MATGSAKNKVSLFTAETARGYVSAGISVIPVARDGSKAPDSRLLPREQRNGKMAPTWNPYKERLATEKELASWFDGPQPAGIAIVGGEVSGALEMLDFDRDAEEVFPRWCELVETEAPGLVERLSIVETPSGGYHVRYRSPDEDIPGNTDLARYPKNDPHVKAKGRIIIQTRGSGGYCVVPGSPADCHETGRPYVHRGGPVIPPAITPDERECLWSYARSFNHEAKEQPRQTGLDLRPGDDYDVRGPDWALILEPHDWCCISGSPAGERRWRRPHKERGWSATTGHCYGSNDADLLFVFSSNATPFEDGKAYGKFRAFALLNHNGDLSAAADALAKQGYGSRRTASSKSHERNGTGTEERPSVLVLESLAAMRPRPIRWLVRPYIPQGKIVLIAGDGGHGKSALTLHLAACLSRGVPALGLSCPESLAGDTLLIQCEDDWEDTIMPRLLAHGAAASHIHRQKGVSTGQGGEDRPFTLADYKALERTLKANPAIRLVVIDPAGAYVGAKVDDHRDSELRTLLGPLAELAAATGVTILLVKHFNKGPNAKAVHKISGSVGYVNTVRAAFVVLPAENDKDCSYFLPVKFNLARTPKGLSFRRVNLSREEANEILAPFAELSEDDRQRIEETLFRLVDWQESDADAEAMQRDRGPSKVERCCEWLKEFLREYAFPDKELLTAAKQAGFTFDNLKNAKVRLRQDNPPLRSAAKQFRGVWWNGFGDPDSWKLRPENDAPQTPQTHETGQTPSENHRAPSSLGSLGSLGSGLLAGRAVGDPTPQTPERSWTAPDADPETLIDPF
jgi:hypothetical protein